MTLADFHLRIFESLFAIDRWQTTQIFGDHRFHFLDIDVSYEVECKVACIFETVFVHFYYTVIVDLVHHIFFHAERTWVIAIQCIRNGITECSHRISVGILQFCFHAVLVRFECFVVLAGSSESQISKLHHCFKVFRRTTTGNRFCCSADTGSYRSTFACKCFTQVYFAEVTDTTNHCYAVDLRDIQDLFVGELAATTEAGTFHQNLVSFVVSRFDVYFHTVGQNEFRCSVNISGFFRNDLSAFRFFFQQWFVRYLVFVRLQVERLHLFQQSSDFFFCRVFQTFLLRTCQQYYLIVVSDQLLHHLINRCYRNVRSQLIHHSIFVFNARHRFIVEEVADIFVDISVIFHLFAFVVSRFYALQIVGTGTVIFSFGESEAACAFSFFENGFHSQFDTIDFAAGVYSESIFSLSYEEVAITCACTGERRIRLLADLCQAAVQHRNTHAQHILNAVIVDCILQ